MVLWIGLAVMTGVAAIAVLIPLMRPERAAVAPDGGSDGGPAATAAPAGDLVVYKDQLAEIARDREAGLIGAGEAEAARVEIARRLLRAGRRPAAAVAGAGSLRRIVALGVVLGLPLVGLGVYLDLGRPDLADAPLAARKSLPLDQLTPAELMARLEAALVGNPDDGRAWELAARLYFRSGRMDDAAHAMREAIRVLGSSDERQSQLGEALVNGAEGVVTAEAREAFDAAVALNPKALAARMYLALAREQDGDKDAALAAWKALKGESAGGEAWLEIVDGQIAKLEGRQPPPATPPALSASDKVAVDGMVAGLADRLAKTGGSPAEWGRLMRSYVVLGRRDDALGALDRARGQLKDDATALAALEATAKELGL
jgi:cytochrome c-type biogenesis protein CcmH